MLKIENIKFNPMDFNQLYAWCREYQKEHGYPPMVNFLYFNNNLYDLDNSPCFWLSSRIISITHLSDVSRGVEELRKDVLEGNCRTMPMHVYDYVCGPTIEVVGWVGNDDFLHHLTDMLLRNNPDFDYKVRRDNQFITHCKSGLKLSERNCTTIVRGEDGRLKEVNDV